MIQACVGVDPLEGDHVANGRVEMAVREVKRQCRTFPISAEQNTTHIGEKVWFRKIGEDGVSSFASRMTQGILKQRAAVIRHGRTFQNQRPSTLPMQTEMRTRTPPMKSWSPGRTLLSTRCRQAMTSPTCPKLTLFQQLVVVIIMCGKCGGSCWLSLPRAAEYRRMQVAM